MRANLLAGIVSLVGALALGLWLIHPSAQAQPAIPLSSGTPVQTREVTSANLTPRQSSADVRTLEDLSIFDLRGWHKPAPSARGRDASPAEFVNVLRMRKLRDVRDDISHYATSGSVIDLACLTLACTAERAQFAVHEDSWTEYALKADISHVKRGDEFLHIVHGTYWDGFRNDTLESAETYLDYDGDPSTRLRLVILFSPKKPARIVSLTRVDEKTSASFTLPLLEVVGVDTPRTVFNWDVRAPVRGSHYVAAWRW